MTIRTFALERFFAQWEFTAPYIMTASDCETMSIGELLELTNTPLARLTELRLNYTESQGDPALREIIATFYPGLSAADIIVTNAPEEAIFITMMTLLQPGERVVVQSPCYQSLSEIATYRGCTVEAWPLRETDDGWQLDLDHLAELLTPEAKLLVLNAPHNPTGFLPSLEEFEAIVQLVRERNIWLFCDEMYRGLEYDPAQRLPSASTRYERAISLWGMSKTFGLPGLRIGWLALQDEVLRESLMQFKDYTTICNSGPGELLSQVALENAQKLINRNLAIIQQNLSHVQTLLAACPAVFEWRPPQAGPIAFARLREGSSSAFCDSVVQDSGVLLAPSTVFDFGDQHVRFGLGRKNFGEGLEVLVDYLQQVNK